MTPRSIASVAEGLEAQNRGLEVWSSHIGFATPWQAQAATRQFKEMFIRAVTDDSDPSRIVVVYDKKLANLVARVIISCEGTTRSKSADR